jgi:hypothetical protein
MKRVLDELRLSEGEPERSAPIDATSRDVAGARLYVLPGSLIRRREPAYPVSAVRSCGKALAG